MPAPDAPLGRREATDIQHQIDGQQVGPWPRMRCSSSINPACFVLAALRNPLAKSHLIPGAAAAPA